MVFSAQQIKFEFLSYMKEFGTDPAAWRVGVAEDARQALFLDNGVDEVADMWLWKPTLSAAAALLVFNYFKERFGIDPAVHTATSEARSVFLFRRTLVEAHAPSDAKLTAV